MPTCWIDSLLLIKVNNNESYLTFNGENYFNKSRPIRITPNQHYDIIIHNNNKVERKKIVFYKSNIHSILLNTTNDIKLVNSSKDKSVKDQGRILCINRNGTIEYNDTLISIKGRGNWTWSHSIKKPYNIKTKKTALFGLNTNKSFVLLSNPFDNSHIRNWLALNIAKQVSLPFSLNCDFCSLYINGEFKGLYLITEKIHIGKGNINISKKSSSDISGGYLLEYNDYIDDSSQQIRNVLSGMAISVKEPQRMDIEQSEYIQNYYNKMIHSICNHKINSSSKEYFTNYIDITSFSIYYLLQEIFYNYDAGWGSMFMYKNKTSIDSLFYAGPLWDMDNTMRPWWGGSINEHYNIYILKSGILPYPNEYKTIFPELCKHPVFIQAIKNNFNKQVKPVLDNYFNKRFIKELHDSLKTDIKLNNLIWKNDFTDGSRDFKLLYDFMKKRIDYINNDLNRPTSEYKTVIIDVNYNFPKHRHLLELHLCKNDTLKLIMADTPKLTFDGCYNINGEQIQSNSIVCRDMYLTYRYHKQTIIEKIKSILSHYL
jgi:hypothetical protein